MAPAFVLPEVEENADSWGPQTVPPQFDGVPFMPFQKGERLGRIADFGQMAGRGMFADRRYRDREPAPGMALFNFEKTEEVRCAALVDIRPEWQVLGDVINLSALNKLSKQVTDPEEVTSCGALAFYDKAADRVTPKNPAKLRKTAHRARSGTASDDPVMRRLAGSGAGDVFMTDDVLATLMCAPRSNYPWDIVITKRGDVLVFDKRANSSLDFLTNGETAPDPLPEEKDNINGMQQLSMEATSVNQAFREQVLPGEGERHKLKEACPSELAGEGAGYKYLKWTLGDASLVVRCTVDAAIKLGDSTQLVAVHALNEFDPKWSGVDWRQKLENQRGAVLATELKNNANKIAKWTAAALVSGIDMIKLGYVSRALPRDNRNHVILGTQAVKPRDFAAQMNLNMDNCWGIISALVNLCMDSCEADGKYLLVRDPNKPQLRLYAIPAAEELHYAGEAGAAAGGADEE
ncbi:hypothetical protein COHA_000661 [Chlorella ohadii]|uniref:Eukaryotic translation initiation factor 3 subunit 7 n=1 Tax=Chlorella ohadii TaxID=2649997 RepID=A0AAD5E0I4_9CHLO|nr:hypothetical protein COHA_000661 [Chlorella ohadii]